jgi:hypothetical protein
MSLAVICPTRSRIENARAAYLSFLGTKRRLDTIIVFAIDEDDPDYLGYKQAFTFNGDYHHLPTVSYPHAGGMGNALNAAALPLAQSIDVIGFIGDDHRFRTPNLDTHITDQLRAIGGGIAYCDDLAQRINLPTQVFISSAVIRTLGWMALPGAKHLYLDNAWKDLGEALDRLLYFPGLVIEHLHPAYGKAEWDENYLRVNDQAVYNHDAEVFGQWKAAGFDDDVARIRAVLERDGNDGGLERRTPAQETA